MNVKKDTLVIILWRRSVSVIFLKIIECTDPWAITCNLENLLETIACSDKDGILFDNLNKLCVCDKGKYKGKRCLDQPEPDTNCIEEEEYSCIDCPIGTYKEDIGIPLLCEDCPKGTYASVVGLYQCMDCPPGTYGPTTDRKSVV